MILRGSMSIDKAEVIYYVENFSLDFLGSHSKLQLDSIWEVLFLNEDNQNSKSITASCQDVFKLNVNNLSLSNRALIDISNE